MRVARIAFGVWLVLASLLPAAPALAQGPFTDLLSGLRQVEGTGSGAPDVRAVPAAPRRPILGGLDHFFEREPLGFGVEGAVALEERVEQLAGDGLHAAADWWALPPAQRALHLGMGLASLLLLALLWWLDRRLGRSVDTSTEKITLGGRQYLASALVGALRAASRLVFPAVALLLSYVPLRGLAGDALWTHVVSRLVLLWLIWRGLTVLTRQLLNSRVIEITDRHARLCRRTILWAVRTFVWFQAATAVLDALGAEQRELALLDFAMRLALTAVTARLLFIKSAVMDLLPDVGPGLYLRFRTTIDRFYYPLTGATTVLVLMWAFGYERSSLSILWRVYAALGLLVVASLILRRVVTWLDRERTQKDERARGLVSRLVDDAAGFFRFFLILVLLLTALAALGLYGPLLGALGYPLVALGSLQLSLLSFLKAALVFVVFLVVSRVVRTLLEVRVYPRFELDEGLAYAVSATVHYALLVIGIFAALLSTGLDLTALGVFVGALGIGIGLGLQELVRDTVAGFVLLFGRAVQKGDFIAAPDGTRGEVQRVGVRSVTVKTRDHLELLIPTSQVVNGTIVNYSHTSPLIRAHVAVGVAYGADPKRVRDVLLEAAEAFPYVVKTPKPQVWLVGFGDSSVNYQLLVWMNIKKQSEQGMRGELYYVIWEKLHDAEIEIPFPQRDLHIKSIEAELPGRRDEAAA